jgi:esterase/lipase superfamily enzyme
MHRKRSLGEVTGSARLFQELREKMQAEGQDALIYIHGFANGFDSAMARAAQIKEAYRITPYRDGQAGEPYEPSMFAFSWPSDGKIQPPWKYASDRDDAALSGVAMARALRRFVDFLNEGEACRQGLHLVAHSMGNWALRHAVLGLRALMSERRLPKIFENAFLMAADEDEDCFEHAGKLAALTQLAQAVHVYHSRDDLALKVSDATKANMDRLGASGPRSFSGINARIAAIDCGKVDRTEVAHGNHQYYRLREEVIADVRQVLDGHLRPEDFPDRTVVEPGRRYRIKG